MILVILYGGAGIYLLLMAVGLLHRSYFRKLDGHTRTNVRTATVVFGIGLILLSLYYWNVYFVQLPEQRERERQFYERDNHQGIPDEESTPRDDGASTSVQGQPGEGLYEQ